MRMTDRWESGLLLLDDDGGRRLVFFLFFLLRLSRREGLDRLVDEGLHRRGSSGFLDDGLSDGLAGRLALYSRDRQ